MSDIPSEPPPQDRAQPEREPELEPKAKSGPEASARPAGSASAAPAVPVPPGAVPPGQQPRQPQPQPPQQRAVAATGWPAGSRPPHPWAPPTPPADTWLTRLRPAAPAPVTAPTLWAVLATAVLSALLLGEGIGLNLMIVAAPAVLAAAFAARAAGRRLRPWTLVWAVGGLALLAVPALRDAGWPTFLAIVTALGVTALALHGGRGWPSVLFAPLGLFDSLGSGTAWAWHGVRDRADGSRGRWGPVVRTVGVAAGLLVVFGALFAGADAAFADLLGSLIPDIPLEQAPWRLSFFLLGLFGAIAVARTAAAPLRWDRMAIRPGRARARLEWALPLIVLNLLFAAFNAVQLAVLFGGYDKVLSETGLTYSAYARQGFWQLLMATLLTLAVIALALRWAPRADARDRTLVRAVLGTLCVLTLVVVASALRRMDLYVDAYGLTRLRISVAVMETWLGLVILLIMAAGVFGARLLPRAVAVSAAAGMLAFGLASPDALVAERNIERFSSSGKIDIPYLAGLSADAVPALDRLPEPQRSCALIGIEARLRADDGSWYDTSWSEARARTLLAERGTDPTPAECGTPSREDEYDPYGDGDPYDDPYTDPYDTP
ncbi:DUF4173 domain-containing protein [Streptomyces sp. P9(2023)]|uniref:DUF4153 domain-containing protein n=1 Tax=Streptomyces sp. P9(2023) TaxID=3064394 RepID=UPI0028F42B1F|nr:DUF4173 domain-containing protein [Streptomyces sp. P9(2023)]MDT9690425.1 DUF4173 domain-containing protein [Streptomyces sp. P9(2023)]